MIEKQPGRAAFQSQRLFIPVNFLDLCQNIGIGRAEGEVINFTGMNPADVIVLQCLGVSCGDGTVEQGQTNQDIRIFVDHLHELLPNFHIDGQLFRLWQNEEGNCCRRGNKLPA